MFQKLISKHGNRIETDLRVKRNMKYSQHPAKHVPRLSSRVTIPMKKYDPEVFQGLVQFVHCGSIEISEANVVGM